MQLSWQTLSAQGCSTTVNEKWSSHPSWSESATETHCFPAACPKWVCKKATVTKANVVEILVKMNQLRLRHMSGVNNSRAGGLMKASSPEVSAAPNICRSSVLQLKYTLTVWHERYKNAIWGSAKSIMQRVILGEVTEIRHHPTPFDPDLLSYEMTCWPRSDPLDRRTWCRWDSEMKEQRSYM